MCVLHYLHFLTNEATNKKAQRKQVVPQEHLRDLNQPVAADMKLISLSKNGAGDVDLMRADG